jgi:hypothetical protein
MGKFVRTGVCGLCNQERELLLGHIVPSFVYDYVKRSSVTGLIREIHNPNLVAQDGDKDYLFCSECEQIFGIEEKSFAENIFVPLHEHGLREFQYDFHLGRFCAVQVLRSLIFFERNGGYSSAEPSPRLTKKVSNAREYLREFILKGGKRQNE